MTATLRMTITNRDKIPAALYADASHTIRITDRDNALIHTSPGVPNQAGVPLPEELWTLADDRFPLAIEATNSNSDYIEVAWSE